MILYLYFLMMYEILVTKMTKGSVGHRLIFDIEFKLSYL